MIFYVPYFSYWRAIINNWSRYRFGSLHLSSFRFLTSFCFTMCHNRKSRKCGLVIISINNLCQLISFIRLYYELLCFLCSDSLFVDDENTEILAETLTLRWYWIIIEREVSPEKVRASSHHQVCATSTWCVQESTLITPTKKLLC